VTRSLAPTHAPRPAPARPWSLFVGLLLVVVMAHALLLTGLPPAPGGDGVDVARVLSVRQVTLPAPSKAQVPSDVVPAAAAPARPARPRVPPVSAPALPVEVPTEVAVEVAVEVAAPVSAVAAVDAEPPLADAATAASAPDAMPAESTLVAAAGAAPVDARSSPPAGETLPTYPTRVPPAATLRYELRRGVLTGQGELTWRPAPEGYELQIEGQAFGLSLLGWGSQGGFDAAGLAPRRFVDRRRGRDVRAANFQRDKGVITWSGVTSETPLAAGAQDRLSWMLQLASIAEADPARLVAGARVLMQVAGARGDADVWTFVVGGREGVDVVGHRIDGTLVLRRAPRKPYDTRVEVWLDPARHHLPVRLKLSTGEGGDSLEFLLRP
jgi:hypothetical protein